jgi:hypothetical protein
MSEDKVIKIPSRRMFKIFVSFQNQQSYYSMPISVVLWDVKINLSKVTPQFSMYKSSLQTLFKTTNDVNALHSDWVKEILVNTFLLNTNVTLTSFFLSNSLDVPYTFAKVCSLARSFSSNTLIKLTSVLMRHGKKKSISNKVSEALVRLAYLQSLKSLPVSSILS